MFRASWADEQLNGCPLTWKTFQGELKELAVEVVHFNWKGIKEEFSDTMYALSCAVLTTTKGKVDLPVPESAVEKCLNRFAMWEQIFERHHLIFDKKYLVNGANYMKAAKVDKALRLAEADQINIGKW